MKVFSSGFIAKEVTQEIPFIGTISKQIGCLFVNRNSSESRHLIVNLIFTIVERH
jgi:1-acyl-sn-glycerol-3-phosphate acyltransferase